MIGYGYFTARDLDLHGLARLCERNTAPLEVPLSQSIDNKIPVYSGAFAREKLAGSGRRELLAEWAWVFGRGPGLILIRNAIDDESAISDASEYFLGAMAEEAESRGVRGDHFAGTGNNSRLWNAAQKLCLARPNVFARYFGSPLITAAAEAWLGPGFQLTAQVNLVHPGSDAQTGHRDYHLGFQSTENVLRYPSQVHALSPILTLQGGIAHCDMPVESGPTRYLPFSQLFGPGYAVTEQEEFQELFESSCVQLALNKGDAIFFNPALMHAAGRNTSNNIDRLANLLQIGSAFGRTLENLDRVAMAAALYPSLVNLREQLGIVRCHAAIECCTEGYPFPTNLDNEPPVDSLMPESQGDLMKRALAADWSQAEFEASIVAEQQRKLP